MMTVINWLMFFVLLFVFVELMVKIVFRLMRLHLAGVQLYLAGRWECATVSEGHAADLWARFRDALGLPKGTATALGLGDADTLAPIPTLKSQIATLKNALRLYRKTDHFLCQVRSDGTDNRCNRCKATDKLLSEDLSFPNHALVPRTDAMFTGGGCAQ
jgi:hypothetical protein